MTALRIALIASARFPLREPFMGGLEAHTHALAGALRQRGHDLTVMAGPGEPGDLPVTTVRAAGFASSGAARDDVGAPPEVWMREHHAYLQFLVGLARGDHGPFDVVHNNSLHHLPIAMAGLLPAPLVTTLHTPPVAWLESAAAVAGGASRFVAVSQHTARAWQHVCDATVIGNGVDTDFWSPRPRGGAPYLVWSGRLVPEKAPHEAVAAARAAGMPLVLAGPVHDRDYFRAAVEPALDDDVRYLGHLGSTALRDVVAGAAAALVTPRWDEPFGLVAAEALACGTPVVGYDSGALGEVVAPGTGRLVPTGDVDALGGAVREALALDRAAVRESAVRRLGHARMVDDYERLYRSLRRCPDAA